MPTKPELVAYASTVGVDVSESWTKAEIETALTDAGYDPTTVGANTMETEPEEAEGTAAYLEGTSSDASFSTYTRVDVQALEGEVNPPPGPLTQQERGTPTEGGGTVFSANR